MIDPRSESFQKQALGYTRAFFLFLDRSYGFAFPLEVRREIVKDAYRDTANHVNKHRIFQRNLDGFKVTSFLAYYTAKYVLQTNSHGGMHDPAREACTAGVMRLSQLLKVETSNRLPLAPREEAYLISMLYAELTENCEVGIGPNGLSSIFTFVSKDRYDAEFLKKL